MHQYLLKKSHLYQILTNDDEVCIPSLFGILLAVQALCFLGQLRAPENLYDATLYFGGNANRRSRTQHTTGTVRNSASARWRQSNRSRTQYCVRSRCPNETLQEGHHLIDSHHKKNNMKVRLNSIFLLRYKNLVDIQKTYFHTLVQQRLIRFE